QPRWEAVHRGLRRLGRLDGRVRRRWRSLAAERTPRQHSVRVFASQGGAMTACEGGHVNESSGERPSDTRSPLRKKWDAAISSDKALFKDPNRNKEAWEHFGRLCSVIATASFATLLEAEQIDRVKCATTCWKEIAYTLIVISIIINLIVYDLTVERRL